MKYTVIDGHSNFNFHDAYINSVKFSDGCMRWDIAALQTPAPYTPQKKIGKNNCYIKNGLMTLENAHIESIVYGGYELRDKKGTITESQPPATASPGEYSDILKNTSYENFSYIHGAEDLPAADDAKYRVCFYISGYNMTVAFTKSVIEWDEFGGSEWYGNKLWTNYQRN